MDNDDYSTILLLARGCSLATSPGNKDNWIERSGPGGKGGSLPNYICKVAKGIMRSGKTRSQAIAIAVSRMKKWAAGGSDVNADTRAKAAKALAQWQALKAKNKAKQVVAASYVNSRGEEDGYLMLTNIPSYKTDIVRMAWEAQERASRESEASRASQEEPGLSSYRWIRELWTDFIIVEDERGGQSQLVKVEFTVNPLTHKVTFGEETLVRQVYIETEEELTDNERELLSDLLD